MTDQLEEGAVHGDYVLTGDRFGPFPIGRIREGLPNAGVRVIVHSAVRVEASYR